MFKASRGIEDIYARSRCGIKTSWPWLRSDWPNRDWRHGRYVTTTPSILGRVRSPAHVLIVDDERSNRQLLKVMLAPEGFSLLLAASGEEALALVATQPPDLILLDIMMPGMDGYEVLARLKASRGSSSIPVIMISALDDRPARMVGLQAGTYEGSVDSNVPHRAPAPDSRHGRIV